jgi:hypothetical protein
LTEAAFNLDDARRIAKAVKKVEADNVQPPPFGAADARDAPPVLFVKLTSTTKTGSRYPGKVLLRQTDTDAFADLDDVLVRPANGEDLDTGVYYLAMAGDVVDGKQEYVAIFAAGSTVGAAVSGHVVITSDGAFGYPTPYLYRGVRSTYRGADNTHVFWESAGPVPKVRRVAV